MAEKKTVKDEEFTRSRVPSFFTLQNIVIVASVLTTIGVGWGMLSARLSHVEDEQTKIYTQMEVHKENLSQELNELKRRHEELKNSMQQHQLHDLTRLNDVEGELRKELTELEKDIQKLEIKLLKKK